MGKVIMIAEERPETLHFWRGLFEEQGFTVITAEDGATAWELFRAWSFEIRAVLVGDLMQPPLDGIDLIRRIRHLPVVVATSYGPDYMLLAKMAGAAAVMRKFDDVGHLVGTIKRISPDPREPRAMFIPRRRRR